LQNNFNPLVLNNDIKKCHIGDKKIHIESKNFFEITKDLQIKHFRDHYILI